MRSRIFYAIVGTAWMVAPVTAQVTVQQPVVQSFGASTTVSVPDRGRTHIASVNSAAASHSMSGPFRSGASLGMQAQGSSISAGVYIHDLQAMDEALLATAPSAPANDVWSQRLAERRGARLPAAVASRDAKPANRAPEWEALAQRAEQRGKPAVALLYWRMAAKEGSTLAQSKLAGAERVSRAASTSTR